MAADAATINAASNENNQVSEEEKVSSFADKRAASAEQDQCVRHDCSLSSAQQKPFISLFSQLLTPARTLHSPSRRPDPTFSCSLPLVPSIVPRTSISMLCIPVKKVDVGTLIFNVGAEDLDKIKEKIGDM